MGWRRSCRAGDVDGFLELGTTYCVLDGVRQCEMNCFDLPDTLVHLTIALTLYAPHAECLVPCAKRCSRFSSLSSTLPRRLRGWVKYTFRLSRDRE